MNEGTDSMNETEVCGRGDARWRLGGLHELRREDDDRSKTISFFGHTPWLSFHPVDDPFFACRSTGVRFLSLPFGKWDFSLAAAGK